jgi:hypothetical protein
MATRVRNQREIVVEDLREQRQVWLGHKDQDTTARYEIMDPDYLRECAAATDLIIEKIGRLTRKRIAMARGVAARAAVAAGRHKRRQMNQACPLARP